MPSPTTRSRAATLGTASAATALALSTLAAPAQAASSFTMWGDLNGDRRTDRVVMYFGQGTCTAKVRLRQANGKYGRVTTRTFSVADGFHGNASDCPSMGVITDMDGDGRGEVALSWGDGSPLGAGLSRNLLVLDDTFKRKAIYDIDNWPSNIQARSMQGTRRGDLVVWSDQNRSGFVYHSTPSGEPRWAFSFDCADRGGMFLANLNSTPGTDVLTSSVTCERKGEVNVWDGKTGEKTVVVAADDDVEYQRIYPVDADRDGRRDDVFVDRKLDNGTRTKTYYVRNASGTWEQYRR